MALLQEPPAVSTIKKYPWIKKQQDFTATMRRGRAVHGKFLVLRYAPGAESDTRFGFVVSKSVGGAVERNHVKRRLRELARASDVNKLWDFIFIAKPAIATARFEDVKLEFGQLLGKAGVLVKL